ncbi:MAG: TatD family hydrolase [Coriobacteriia bacterium]
MSEGLSALPDLGALTVDSHAHLDMLEDPAGALANAALSGVALVATVVDLTEDTRTFDEIDGWLADASRRLTAAGRAGLTPPEVRIVVGAHPHNAKAFDPGVESRMRETSALPRVAAFGELGLDYHYDYSPRDVQRAAFERHLALAHELGMPVIVHLRESHNDGHDMIRDAGAPAAGCVIHCFTEDAATAERFLGLGCLISFAGPVTFKKAIAIREAAAITPLDRLLVETDCPFLAPEPFRGRKNEPAYVTLTAAAVAGAMGLQPHQVASAALENARRLFSRGDTR